MISGKFEAKQSHDGESVLLVGEFHLDGTAQLFHEDGGKELVADLAKLERTAGGGVSFEVKFSQREQTLDSQLAESPNIETTSESSEGTTAE